MLYGNPLSHLSICLVRKQIFTVLSGLYWRAYGISPLDINWSIMFVVRIGNNSLNSFLLTHFFDEDTLKPPNSF